MANAWQKAALGVSLAAVVGLLPARAARAQSGLPSSFGYNYGETDTPRAAASIATCIRGATS